MVVRFSIPMTNRPVYSFFWSMTCSPTCMGSGAAKDNTKVFSVRCAYLQGKGRRTIFVDRCETTDQETKGDEK